MSLFTLRGIRRSYGSRPILDGLDLTVEEGARIGIVGGNGSGKSILLRIMSGDEEADAGEGDPTPRPDPRAAPGGSPGRDP